MAVQSLADLPGASSGHRPAIFCPSESLWPPKWPDTDKAGHDTAIYSSDTTKHGLDTAKCGPDTGKYEPDTKWGAQNSLPEWEDRTSREDCITWQDTHYVSQ